MEVDMNAIIAENGKIVTDDMITGWESALERDEWPEGWQNVGEIVEGHLPTPLTDSVTLSIKIPTAMKHTIETKAKNEGMTTSAYVRGILANQLISMA